MISDPTELSKGKTYKYKARTLTYSHAGERGYSKAYVFRSEKGAWVELTRNKLRQVTALEPLPRIDFSKLEAFNNQ